MESKQLRVGNYALRASGEIQIIDARDIGMAFYFSPIPLTEEWILKFFNIHRRNGNNWLFDFSENFTCMWDGERILIEEYSEGEFPLSHIKHVHQLQNLFFALTGEELLTNKENK